MRLSSILEREQEKFWVYSGGTPATLERKGVTAGAKETAQEGAAAHERSVG